MELKGRTRINPRRRFVKAGSSSRSGWRWEAAAGLAALLLFARTVGFGWVYDDQMEIVLNPFVQSLGNLPLIFSTTAWAGSGMETYLYRPLPLASFALNHLVSGLAPWSYHLVNVLLFAGISVMVVRVGRLWGLTGPAAGLAGLIFALHPIHVEVVAAVFGRKDLLAAFFVLAMVISHPRAARRGGLFFGLPVLAYAGAMLSKEVGVVGVALVAAQDWFMTRDRKDLFGDPRRARLFAAYVATLLAYVLVRNQVVGGMGVPDTFYMDNPLVQAPLDVRLGTALAVLGKGLALQLLPLAQSPDYSFDAIPLVGSVLDPRLLGSLGLLALLVWALAASRTRRPILALAVVWYFLTALPTANILVLVGTIFGERLLFLPSVAFCLVAGMAGSRILEKNRWAILPITLWVVFLSLQTVRYAGAWDNDVSLFRAAVAAVPTSTKANHKLGEELLRAGELGPALPYLREALRIAPDNQFAARTLAQARRQVVQRYLPPDSGARPFPDPPSHPEILYTLGDLSRQRGDLAGARRYWEEALTKDPGHAPSLADLGLLALIQGDTTRAELRLRAAVEENPKLSRAWYNLGRIHLARGDLASAHRALEAFLAGGRRRFPEQAAWAEEVLRQLPDS